MTSAVIRLEVDEVKKWNGEMRVSNVEIVDGLPFVLWIEMEMRGFMMRFKCVYECEHSEWAAEVECTLVVCNKNPAKNDAEQGESTYSSDKCIFGLGRPKSILDSRNGFVVDDRLVVEARFTVCNVTGVPNRPVFDFSSPGVGSDNVALIVEGRKVYVSKNYLAIHSPVFAAMFFGDFAEKNQEDIELKDISHEDFVAVLHLIYPSYRPIWSGSVLSLLAIADLYDIKYIFNKVEEYLLKVDGRWPFFSLDYEGKLLLADKYKLEALKLQCLHKLESIEEVTDVMETEEYTKFSDATKAAMLERIKAIHDKM